MKKIFVLVMVCLVSACSYWNGNDAEERYVVVEGNEQPAKYRYVRRYYDDTYTQGYQNRTVAAEPAIRCCGQRVAVNNCGGCKVAAPVSTGCAPQVRTERVPVEVVYKRVTHKTVYEPKTTSSVEYERVPYSGETCGTGYCK